MELRASQEHLAEAVADARERGLADPVPATDGDLARAALEHLAAQSQDGRELVARAAAISVGEGEREPVTLAVGALVLLAFRTELRLEHNPGQGWKFALRTRPLQRHRRRQDPRPAHGHPPEALNLRRRRLFVVSGRAEGDASAPPQARVRAPV